MPSVLITGAKRNIGLSFTRKYLRLGWEVFATGRQMDTANALIELSRENRSLQILELDVTMDSQIETLKNSLENDSLDLLIHNAAMFPLGGTILSELDFSYWNKMFDTNVVAPLKLTVALLPALKRSKFSPKIIALSTIKASNHRVSMGGAYQYRTTKAALNILISTLAVDLKDDKITVAAISPGWVSEKHANESNTTPTTEQMISARRFLRELGSTKSILTPDESTEFMCHTINELGIENTGQFLDERGGTIPW